MFERRPCTIELITERGHFQTHFFVYTTCFNTKIPAKYVFMRKAYFSKYIIINLVKTTNPLKTRKVEVHLYAMLHDFRKTMFFGGSHA